MQAARRAGSKIKENILGENQETDWYISLNLLLLWNIIHIFNACQNAILEFFRCVFDFACFNNFVTYTVVHMRTHFVCFVPYFKLGGVSLRFC
jgi:hypothetical protein